MGGRCGHAGGLAGGGGARLDAVGLLGMASRIQQERIDPRSYAKGREEHLWCIVFSLRDCAALHESAALCPKFSNIIVDQNIDLTKLLKDLLHQIIDLELKPLQRWNIRQQKPFGLQLSP